jgi:hypothetical protein
LRFDQLQERRSVHGVDQSEVTLDPLAVLADVVEPHVQRFTERQAEQLTEARHGRVEVVDVVERGGRHSC